MRPSDDRWDDPQAENRYALERATERRDNILKAMKPTKPTFKKLTPQEVEALRKKHHLAKGGRALHPRVVEVIEQVRRLKVGESLLLPMEGWPLKGNPRILNRYFKYSLKETTHVATLEMPEEKAFIITRDN